MFALRSNNRNACPAGECKAATRAISRGIFSKNFVQEIASQVLYKIVRNHNRCLRKIADVKNIGGTK